jgi:hypothetical protein
VDQLLHLHIYILSYEKITSVWSRPHL